MAAKVAMVGTCYIVQPGTQSATSVKMAQVYYFVDNFVTSATAKVPWLLFFNRST